MAIAPLIHETPPASYPSHRAPDTSDLLVSYLGQLGVQFVFGVPGGAIEPLYNALARGLRYGGPRSVVARHETGAAFMAQGYAVATRRLGVCCVTTGPGATNALTGVASAFQEEVPMLLVTAQTSLGTFGKGGFQESTSEGVDTLAIFRHCTRYNSLVSHPAQFEHKLVAALNAAFGDTPGPVHLSFPSDLMRGPAPAGAPSFDLGSVLRRPALVDEGAIEQLAALVRQAHRPVIIVGKGAAGAGEVILRVAESLDAPVLTTPSGKGVLDPHHPRHRGLFGFAGHDAARAILADPEADLLLAVGTSLSEWDTAGWDEEALLNNRLVHVDVSEEHLARSPMARLRVRGNVAATFAALEKRLGDGRVAEEKKEQRVAGFTESPPPEAGNGIKPQALMEELGQRFPQGTRFVSDVGNSTAWALHWLNPDTGNATGWFGTSTQFAAMGWALGNAVGMALGDPSGPVVCITGDGSMLMNGQELTVAVAQSLAVIFVVLNDGALGMIKHGQQLNKAEPIAYDLPPVDFSAIARAMGAEAFRIRTLDELRALDVQALCGRGGPTLIEVLIDPDEVPPIDARIKVLGENHGT